MVVSELQAFLQFHSQYRPTRTDLQGRSTIQFQRPAQRDLAEGGRRMRDPSLEVDLQIAGRTRYRGSLGWACLAALGRGRNLEIEESGFEAFLNEVFVLEISCEYY